MWSSLRIFGVGFVLGSCGVLVYERRWLAACVMAALGVAVVLWRRK